MKPRRKRLEDLLDLPRVGVVTQEEFLLFVEVNKLFGTGLSLVDAHLIASCVLFPGMLLWSRDRRLVQEAGRLNVAYQPLAS